MERRFYKIEGGAIREGCFLKRWIYKIGGLFGIYMGFYKRVIFRRVLLETGGGGFLESGAD